MEVLTGDGTLMKDRQEISDLVCKLIAALESEIVLDHCSMDDKRRIKNAISYLNERKSILVNKGEIPNIAIAFDHLGLMDYYMNRPNLHNIVQSIDEKSDASGFQLQLRRN
ncbi:hypothetical protein [Sphingorhabdus sp.]|uniref:hypothetical protein n=1 Tax=Sphingorhabdus sp. TaxID=1902408 RepID=UPI0035AF0A4B|nr:hypothetical protein [Sphingomonadaceae bacterium]